MKKVIVIFIIVILGLIGYAVYLNTSFFLIKKTSFAKPSDSGIIPETTDEEQKEYLIDLGNSLLKAFYSANREDTAPIAQDTTIKFHRHYIANRSSGDTSRAVYFTMKEIFAGIRRHYDPRTQINSTNLDDCAFYAYLIKYTKDSLDMTTMTKVYKKDQVSVAIQLAKDRGANKPIVHDELYNLGDLCPPKCAENEKITRE